MAPIQPANLVNSYLNQTIKRIRTEEGMVIGEITRGTIPATTTRLLEATIEKVTTLRPINLVALDLYKNV